MTTQVAQDLRAAAEVLRRDGWCQGAYQDGARRCLVGALDSIYADRPTEDEELAAYAVLERVIGTLLLPQWNDRSDRTADEVIAALEAAAAAVEAEA